jgi:hypothetical protein
VTTLDRSTTPTVDVTAGDALEGAGGAPSTSAAGDARRTQALLAAGRTEAVRQANAPDPIERARRLLSRTRYDWIVSDADATEAVALLVGCLDGRLGEVAALEPHLVERLIAELPAAQQRSQPFARLIVAMHRRWSPSVLYRITERLDVSWADDGVVAALLNEFPPGHPAIANVPRRGQALMAVTNPTLDSTYVKPDYVRLSGPATTAGVGDVSAIAPDDIQQGGLGNCWILAQLAAQARANPASIQHLIRDHGNGLYTVTLYLYPRTPMGGPGHDATGERRIRTDILVDGVLPMLTSPGGPGTPATTTPAYSAPGDKGELWPLLFEKAIAKLFGTYTALNGGNGAPIRDHDDDDIFGMLLGKDSDAWQPIETLTADQLLTTLHVAMTAKRAAIVASKEGTDPRQARDADAAGVVTNHAYALEGVDPAARTISLRNPWGKQHLTDTPVAKVMKFFAWFRIAAP